jgi:hypothetical protein
MFNIDSMKVSIKKVLSIFMTLQKNRGTFLVRGGLWISNLFPNSMAVKWLNQKTPKGNTLIEK